MQYAIDEACSSIRSLDHLPPSMNDTDLDQEKTHHPQELLGILESFLQALDKNSPAIAEPLLVSLQGKVARDSFERLQAHIAMFDFRAAKAVTRSIIDTLPSDTNTL